MKSSIDDTNMITIPQSNQLYAKLITHLQKKHYDKFPMEYTQTNSKVIKNENLLLSSPLDKKKIEITFEDTFHNHTISMAVNSKEIIIHTTKQLFDEYLNETMQVDDEKQQNKLVVENTPETEIVFQQVLKFIEQNIVDNKYFNLEYVDKQRDMSIPKSQLPLFRQSRDNDCRCAPATVASVLK